MINLENLKQPYMGRTCKELRERLGVSVIEFANFAGVSRQAVYKFEHGESASLQLFIKYHNMEGLKNDVATDNESQPKTD